MSGYQISNNVPNFFIANSQQELIYTQLGFLQNNFFKPTQVVLDVADTEATGGFSAVYSASCSDLLCGFVACSGNAGGAAAIRLPVGSDLYDCLQVKVYGQQGITVNPPAPNRVEFFQLLPGFTYRCKVYNNTVNTLLPVITPGDMTLSINSSNTITIPDTQVGVLDFTVLSESQKTMTVNVLN